MPAALELCSCSLLLLATRLSSVVLEACPPPLHVWAAVLDRGDRWASRAQHWLLLVCAAAGWCQSVPAALLIPRSALSLRLLYSIPMLILILILLSYICGVCSWPLCRAVRTLLGIDPSPSGAMFTGNAEAPAAADPRAPTSNSRTLRAETSLAMVAAARSGRGAGTTSPSNSAADAQDALEEARLAGGCQQC